MNIETAMKYLVNEYSIENSKENRKLILQNWDECKEIADKSKIGGRDGDYFYCGTWPLPNGKTHQDFMTGQLITYFQTEFKNG